MNPVIAAFYDAVQVFVWALNETLALGSDPSDARSLTHRLWNRTFIDGERYRLSLTFVSLLFCLFARIRRALFFLCNLTNIETLTHKIYQFPCASV